MTLGDMKEGEHAEVEVLAAASEEFYLGMSCSSQYSFTAADTGTTSSTHFFNQQACFITIHIQIVHIGTKYDKVSAQNVSSSACFLRRQSRSDIESLETSTESRELRLPSEESAHCGPLFSRWPD